jgi:plastocyanin
MTFTKRTLVAGLALVALVGLTACGDTDDPQPDAAPATTSEGSTTSPSAADGTADCAANPGETVTVEIPEFAFDPNPVAVHVCDSIVWKNTHDQPHTATGNGDVTWNTGTIVPDAESEPVLFDQAGELTYICALHPFMKGTVEVS